MEPSVAWPSSIGTMRGFLFLKKKNIGADSWKNVLVEYEPYTKVLTVTKVDNGGSLVFRKVVSHAVAVRPKLNRRRFRLDISLEASSSLPSTTHSPLPSRSGSLIACFAAANSHEYSRWLTALHTSAQEAVTSCNTSRNSSMTSVSSDHTAALMNAASHALTDYNNVEGTSRNELAHDTIQEGSESDPPLAISTGFQRGLRASSGDGDADRFQGLALADLPEEEDENGRAMGRGSSAGSAGSWASDEERRGEERAEQQRVAGVGLGGIDETPAWRRSLADRELGPSSSSSLSSGRHGWQNDAPIAVDYNDDDPELTASTAFVEMPQRLLRSKAHEARLSAAARDALITAGSAALGSEDEARAADGLGGTSVGALLEAAALPDKELSLLLSSSSGSSGLLSTSSSSKENQADVARAKKTKAAKLKPASKKVVASFRAAVERLPVRDYSVELRSPGSGAGGKFVTVHGNFLLAVCPI